MRGTAVALPGRELSGRSTMDKNVRKRLEQDLEAAVSRLRQMSGAVAVEEYPGAIWDNSPFADEVGENQAHERPEIGFAPRGLPLGRGHPVSAAPRPLYPG